MIYLVEADVVGEATGADGIKQSQSAQTVNVALKVCNR